MCWPNDSEAAYEAFDRLTCHTGNCKVSLVPWMALLQVQQLGTTIDSPLSLLRNGGNFAVSSGGSTLAYFRSALDPVAAALAPRYPSSLPRMYWCRDMSGAAPAWFLTANEQAASLNASPGSHASVGYGGRARGYSDKQSPGAHGKRSSHLCRSAMLLLTGCGCIPAPMQRWTRYAVTRWSRS